MVILYQKIFNHTYCGGFVMYIISYIQSILSYMGTFIANAHHFWSDIQLYRWPIQHMVELFLQVTRTSILFHQEVWPKKLKAKNWCLHIFVSLVNLAVSNLLGASEKGQPIQFQQKIGDTAAQYRIFALLVLFFCTTINPFCSLTSI